MSKHVFPDCISLLELARYFGGDLDSARIEAIDEHRLICPYCDAMAEHAAEIARDILMRDLTPAPPVEAQAPMENESVASAFARVLEKLRSAADAGVCATKTRAETYLSVAPELLFKDPSMQMEWSAADRSRSGPRDGKQAGVTAGFAKDTPEVWLASLPEAGKESAKGRISNGARVSFNAQDKIRVNVDEWPVKNERPVIVVAPAGGGQPQTVAMERLNETDFWAEIELPEGASIVLVASAPKE